MIIVYLWMCLCVQIWEWLISDKTLTQQTNYLGIWDLVLTVKLVMAGVGGLLR